MAASLAVWAIKQYRKRLSPIKGFNCAYGQDTGRATCSGVGLRAFRKAGWIKGWALLRRQLDRCAVSAFELNAAREARSQAGSYKRLAPMGKGKGRRQAGFVDLDCGGCDAPSCDLPSCDLPSCDLPSCDIPSCDLPEAPSCEPPSLPTLRLPPALACESGGGSGWWEALYCLEFGEDCGSCGGSTSGNPARVDKARSRLGAASGRRDERRERAREKKLGEKKEEGDDGDASAEREREA